MFPAHSLRWDYPPLNQLEVCRLGRDVEAQFDAGRQGIDVGLFRQKVWLDLERAIRLRSSDPEIASAEGPDAVTSRRYVSSGSATFHFSTSDVMTLLLKYLDNVGGLAAATENHRVVEGPMR